MLGLTAVVPYRAGVVDRQNKRLLRGPARRFLEARVEAAGQGLAGLGKGRLHDVVVLRVEGEDDLVANVRGGRVGRECEAIGADFDVDRFGGDYGGSKEGGRENGVEVHDDMKVE